MFLYYTQDSSFICKIQSNTNSKNFTFRSVISVCPETHPFAISWGRNCCAKEGKFAQGNWGHGLLWKSLLGWKDKNVLGFPGGGEDHENKKNPAKGKEKHFKCPKITHFEIQQGWGASAPMSPLWMSMIEKWQQGILSVSSCIILL